MWGLSLLVTAVIKHVSAKIAVGSPGVFITFVNSPHSGIWVLILQSQKLDVSILAGMHHQAKKVE